MRYRYLKTNGRIEKKALVYSQSEHCINLGDIDHDAVSICRRLQDCGYETYIVGGAVRDLLMGKRPKDFDLATAARPPEIKRAIHNTRLIGRRFKLIHVFFGTKIIELATFRSSKDGTTGNTFGKIEEDVMRRDFTMNALFYDPVKEQVIDFVGGVEDIKSKLIKPIIPLGVIFKDDPVRMIRAVKYCAIAGWTIPQALYAKIRSNGALLKTISPSRLTEEITKIIKSPAAGGIIASLEETGLFMYLQPNASALLKKDKNYKKHFFDGLAAGAVSEENTPPPSIANFLRLLIVDYVEMETDWTLPSGDAGLAAAELYKNVFANARKFVLPMNPPRAELERALRAIFNEHGITVKKVRLKNGGFHRRRGK
ncbi:MAG: polynucleotide adenylyltransferase PcnB [Spirochaetaceae bacterium]|nr:polynucleotide adenylyltransferase PcnB [Spirochaetaceae bacterium]